MPSSDLPVSDVDDVTTGTGRLDVDVDVDGLAVDPASAPVDTRSNLPGLIRELRRKTREGGVPDLASILTIVGPDQLAEHAGAFEMAQAAIRTMQLKIAEVEAMGEADAQQDVRKAAMVRQLYTAMTGQAAETQSIGDLMMVIRDNREHVANAERAIAAFEAARLAEIRQLELQDVQGERGHVQSIRQETIGALGDRRVSVENEHEVRVALLEAENAAAAEVARLEYIGEEQVAAEEVRHLDRNMTLLERARHLRAKETHEGTVEDEAAKQRLMRVKQELPLATTRAAELHEKRNRNNNKRLGALESIAVLLAGCAQSASAWFNVHGFHSTSLHPEHPGSWIGPVAAAVALNGVVYVGTVTYMFEKWSPSPIVRGPDGSFRFNGIGPFIATGFVAMVAGTITAGYAGLTRDTIPETVVADASKDAMTEAGAFIESARDTVSSKYTDPAAELVLTTQKAGAFLYDEATGVGPTRIYGFGPHSMTAFDAYQTTVDAAARGLADSGMCDDLERLATNYTALMEQLQAENDRNQDFSPRTFLTVDPSGDPVHNLTVSNRTQIEACRETNPKSPQELIDSIDARLAKIRKGISDGTINDTPVINVEIREMNAELQKLATWLNADTTKLRELAQGTTPTTTPAEAPSTPETTPTTAATVEEFDAPDLQELDPMFYESMGLLWDNTLRLFDGMSDEELEAAIQAGEQVEEEKASIKYPALLLIASIIDQAGIIIAIILIAARRAQMQENRDYIDHLASFEQRKKRAEGLFDRMFRVMGAKKTTVEVVETPDTSDKTV